MVQMYQEKVVMTMPDGEATELGLEEQVRRPPLQHACEHDFDPSEGCGSASAWLWQLMVTQTLVKALEAHFDRVDGLWSRIPPTIRSWWGPSKAS